MMNSIPQFIVHRSSFIVHHFSYQAPDAVQSRGCKPRQAGNGATVADLGCAAASPEPDKGNDECGSMNDESDVHRSSFDYG